MRDRERRNRRLDKIKSNCIKWEGNKCQLYHEQDLLFLQRKIKLLKFIFKIKTLIRNPNTIEIKTVGHHPLK